MKVLRDPTMLRVRGLGGLECRAAKEIAAKEPYESVLLTTSLACPNPNPNPLTLDRNPEP